MQAYALTDIGQKRSVNQDAFFCSTEPVGILPNLFIVADGMGGHKAGDYASRNSINCFVEYVKRSGEQKEIMLVDKAIEAVNRVIYEKSIEDSDYEGMGTTLVVSYISGSKLFVANVGDSRLYLIGSGISQVTEDHSYVAEMVRSGEITAKEAQHHPDKNIITRAIGVGKEVKADFFEVDLQPHDRVLMCSDGLSNMIEDEDLYKILKSVPIDKACETLIDTANRNGGLDNITALVIEPGAREDSEC